MSAERLYTPELLGLAVDLADFPPMETLPLHGEVRSPTCGSTLAIDLSTDEAGCIAQIGMRVRTCAVGQAAASLFARNAAGRDLAHLAAAHDHLAAWLEGEFSIADPAEIWPGLSQLAPARNYAARHPAMLLPWKAAILALSITPSAS